MHLNRTLAEFCRYSNWYSHCHLNTQQNVYIAQHIKIKDTRRKFNKENKMDINF